jgi:hypothetical protein
MVTTDEQTTPLPRLDASVVSREQFNQYLRKRNLTILDIALAGHLRLVHVWKVSRGEPVEPQYAGAIRKALYALTHEPYMGLIAVLFTPVAPSHAPVQHEPDEHQQIRPWERSRKYP